MIIDASVAFKWIFIEDGSETAAGLLGREDLRAPNLLLTEVGNGLWKKGMRGELGDQAAYSAQLGLIASLVDFVPEGPVIPRALEMALALGHAIYDCVYLALAEREGDRLITADEKFAAKVLGSQFSQSLRMLA